MDTSLLSLITMVVISADPFLYWPFENTNATITSAWYYNDGICHKAIDLDPNVEGEYVIAAAGGIVIDVRKDYSRNLYDDKNEICKPVDGIEVYSTLDYLGNYVFIEHGNEFVTRYAHFVEGSILENVNIGNTINPGQRLGVFGNTGCSTSEHLHFQVIKKSREPIDPYAIYGYKWDYPGDGQDHGPSTDPGCPSGDEGYLWLDIPPQPANYECDYYPAVREAYQVVGQDLGIDDFSICSTNCSCTDCGDSGYLRHMSDTNTDGVRVTLTLADIVDESGLGIDTTIIDRYLALADCLNRKLIVAVAPVVPNYNGEYESFPGAWEGIVPYITFELEMEGIETTKVPVLWDENFLYYYEQIVFELGQLLDGDPRVARVLPGYGVWGELVFDLRFHNEDGAGDLTWDVARAVWESNGFSKEAWLAAANLISYFYASSFYSTPTFAQITDVGVLLMYDDEEYEQQAVDGYPGLEELLNDFSFTANLYGIDGLQFNGLAAYSSYGTDEPIYNVLAAYSNDMEISLETFLYSWFRDPDQVDVCTTTPGQELVYDGCTNAELLECALYRALDYGTESVTLWSNEWTDSDTRDIINSWRDGEEMICAYCTDVAEITGDMLRIAERFCPSNQSPPPEFRGNLPGMDWDEGPMVYPSSGWYEISVAELPIGSTYEVTMAGCNTSHGWMNANEWVDTCGETLGEYLHCTELGCNIYFYIDETGTPQPCPDAECDVTINYPDIIYTTGVPYEIGLYSGYLPGASCIEVVGELPFIDWNNGIQSHGDDGAGYFLVLLPETVEPCRFSYVECDDHNNWALYSAACEAEADNGFCYLNEDSSYSLRASINYGIVTSEGN